MIDYSNFSDVILEALVTGNEEYMRSPENLKEELRCVLRKRGLLDRI